MLKPIFRTTLSISLIVAIIFVLSACSGQNGTYMDTTSKNGEYRIAAKSNMLKGLEFRRTEQSTRPINGGIQVLSASDHTDSNPASTQHTNEQLYYWSDVSNAVEQMKGIAKAHVFATNKNVYVALRFLDEVPTEKVTERKGYDEFHRHIVAPRSIAAMPYDHFYNVGQDNIKTNQNYHDVGRLVSNYGAPRQVFISSDPQFLEQLNAFVKIRNKNQSLLPWIHEFNTLVQYYFANSPVEPVKVDPHKLK